MKEGALKRQFFKKGAAALRNLIEIDQECYCCPICKRLYPYEGFDSGELTIEHAPPEKVGGKPLALTCKKCNSVAGYSIDKAVVQRQRQLDFTRAIMGQKSDFKGRGTFSFGGEKLNISFEVDNGIPSIKPLKEINDPKKLKNNKDYMMQLKQTGIWGRQEFSITSDDNYHIKHSNVGDLKTAFIICFAFFGYTYALHKRLSPVRKQIMNYSEEIINGYWLPSDPKVTQKHFICLTETPIVGLAVKLDNSTIFLPWLDGPEDFYKHLEENYIDKGPFTFQGRIYNWPISLEMNMDFMNTHNKQMQPTSSGLG